MQLLRIVLACASIWLLLSFSRSALPSDKKWEIPRTEYGQPDLQGVWDFGTLTPFQRPALLGDRMAHTDAEVAGMERQYRDFFTRMSAKVDLASGAPQVGDKV